MKSLAIKLSLPLLACVVSMASAHNNLASKIDGDWQGNRGSQAIFLRIIVLDVTDGTVAVSLTVTGDRCSGGIDGLGTLQAGTLTFSPYRKETEGEACAVKVMFDPSGRKALLTESSCVSYHGVNCTFEGDISKR